MIQYVLLRPRGKQEAIRLASECDAMVVIGGRDSANSLHLAELCAERCANTQFVENAKALGHALRFPKPTP